MKTCSMDLQRHQCRGSHVIYSDVLLMFQSHGSKMKFMVCFNVLRYLELGGWIGIITAY
jgi:hypothetical protein